VASDRDRPAAYSRLIERARWAADNFGPGHPGAEVLLELADAVERLVGPETVRLAHPDGGRVLIELPMDVGLFARASGGLAKLGFGFDVKPLEVRDAG
jgi:hypothetical protein